LFGINLPPGQESPAFIQNVTQLAKMGFDSPQNAKLFLQLDSIALNSSSQAGNLTLTTPAIKNITSVYNQMKSNNSTGGFTQRVQEALQQPAEQKIIAAEAASAHVSLDNALQYVGSFIKGCLQNDVCRHAGEAGLCTAASFVGGVALCGHFVAGLEGGVKLAGWYNDITSLVNQPRQQPLQFHVILTKIRTVYHHNQSQQYATLTKIRTAYGLN